MEQEALFYAALSAATGFEQADDQLIITYGDNQQLIFSAAWTSQHRPLRRTTQFLGFSHRVYR